MTLQAPKGTRDLFGEDMRIWRQLEDLIRELTDTYGFSEIRTPMFEHTELFLRGVGETTDIVQKEMYSFKDKAGRGLTLRPEMTAGVARAYVENGMHAQPQPTKLYYIGPNFRYENPQFGRYRQHYQFGVELFGAYGAAAEAEVISLGYRLLQRLGVTGVTLHINSIGCLACREDYQRRLKTYLGEHFTDLCPTCVQRFEKNPLRVLDCKVADCKRLLENAPSVLDSLDDTCRQHFESLQALLSAMEIPFTVDPRVVRGLDYYTRTVFEFIENGLTVIGGGRYDGLIKAVGGAETGAVGFGMGIDRMALLLQKQAKKREGNIPDIFIGHADSDGEQMAQFLTYQLRKAGLYAENDLIGRSVKAQMKYAGKLKARYAIILGGNEISQNAAGMKNMETGETQNVPLSDLSVITGLLVKKDV